MWARACRRVTYTATYVCPARFSCIHAMDASDTPRIFNPTLDVACISKQSSRPFSVSDHSAFPFVVHSFLSPPAQPLFFSPAFCSSQCHWISLGKPRQLCVNSGSFPLLSSSELNGTRAAGGLRPFCTDAGGNGPASWIDSKIPTQSGILMKKIGDVSAERARAVVSLRVIFTGSRKYPESQVLQLRYASVAQ